MPRLVLSRRVGESLRINGPAEIRLHDLENGRAKLVIEAPLSTRVLRSELAAAEPSAGDELEAERELIAERVAIMQEQLETIDQILADGGK